MANEQHLSEIFRDRLRKVIKRSGRSMTGFAEQIGIDRSTLSQILAPHSMRLPRVETLTAIAAAEQVSIDWLVGLSEAGALNTDILPVSAEITRGGMSESDEQLMQWRSEALGYKIRYVPTSLPDLLKTDAIIAYEYATAVATPEQRQATTEVRLEYQRRPETDMEVCNSVQALTGFARGEGRWSGLSKTVRRQQLEHIATLVSELYPTFRWFLFDGLARYSVPLTVFGPKRAVIYLGQSYLVVNSREMIASLTQHFDSLIRYAVVQPTAITALVEELLQDL